MFRGILMFRGRLEVTSSLHSSSFVGLLLRFLNITLVEPKKGTTMESVGRVLIELGVHLVVWVLPSCCETFWG